MSDKHLFSFGAIGCGFLSFLFVSIGIAIFNSYRDISYIFLGLGVVMIINLIVILLMIRKYSSKQDNLDTVKAQIIEVKEDTSITINKKHPYYLIVEYDSKTYQSDYYYDNKYKVLDEIDFYINPNDDTDYKVMI